MKEPVFYEAKVMWSQIDANRHLRHSAYADFAAQARLELLESMHFGADMLGRLKLGPILFREELIYMREVRPDDTIRVSCELSKCREDGGRWSFVQKVFRADDIQAALIHVDGAWIDMQTRKLAVLPADIVQQFLTLPKTADFELVQVAAK